MNVEHMPALRISVIIPTRNRAQLLREVIESLWRQTMSPDSFEIIVVDNCSTDGTPELMRAMSTASPSRLRYILLEENRGPVYTRNLGAKLAAAPVLAFTDSDCMAHPEWLARGLAAFDRSARVGLVSGIVLDKPGQEVRFFTLRNGAGHTENYTYPTCNVFYRNSVFHELGGFDESVWLYDISTSPIECADTDFAWRVREAGYENTYSKDIIVYHEVAGARPLIWLLYHTRLLVMSSWFEGIRNSAENCCWAGCSSHVRISSFICLPRAR
jgi:glycosyltransferase involved in cell wall biosynthesis